MKRIKKMITHCHYEQCGKPIIQSKESGYAKMYCSPQCVQMQRRGKGNRMIKPDIYELPLSIHKKFYPQVDNTLYNEQLSEVTGLSRLYLDGEINLHKLRELEINLHA